MALRDQPYIPLYIQDLMTDEKLNNCCAATHGIYIKGLMCLMHKSEEYGKILLQQKFKQTDKQSKNFAIMLVKHLPYTIEEIENAIDELIEENVCYFENDFICQKRMIKDGALSKVRSKVGKLGGEKTKENNDNLLKNLPKQNMQQITEYENEYENEISLINSSNNTNEPIFEKLESTPYIPQPKYSDDEVLKKFESYKNEFLKQSIANERFCMSNRIPLESLQSVLNDFNTSKIGEGQTPSKNIAEYRKWVSNWFNKIPEENRANYRKRKIQVNN